MKRKRRILSLLLSGAMLFSICTPTVFAETPTQDRGQTITEAGGLCEHHPEHNADCGYTEGTAGTPCVHEHTADCYEEVTNCVHEHDEDCYPEESVSGNEATPSGAQKREPENCPHICDEKSGCITKELNCQHEHDDECGYSPATAGTPCGYVCELCGAGDNTPSNAEAVTVASVQAMIDALPNAEEITEDNAEDVKAQLDAIDEAKLHWGRWLRQCYWLMIRLTSSFPSPPAADIILTSPARKFPERQTAICRTAPCTMFPLPMWGRLTPIPATLKV